MEERKMTSRMKIVLSMVVILVAIAATVGGTLAWFTDEAATPENTFIAGTVILDAEDNFFGTSENILDNWNPGDCTPKLVKIEYTGSKNALLRMKINEKWENLGAEFDNLYGSPRPWDTDNDDPSDFNLGGFPDSDPPPVYPADYGLENVKWKIYTGDNDDHIYDVRPDNLADTDPDYDNYLFIKRSDGKVIVNPLYTPIGDHWSDIELTGWTQNGDWYYHNNIVTDETEGLIIFGLVCLDGPTTKNEFQGASYVIEVEFEAIQASNNASGSAWGVNSEYDDLGNWIGWVF